MPHRLVLLRHGESDWNRLNVFTGWTDVDITDSGRLQAIRAGCILRAHGFSFNLAFTSVLKRAVRTLWLVMEELDELHVQDVKSWRLNERHYGALQGLNKAQTAAEYGDAQVHEWRRSYATRPPALSDNDPRHPRLDARYQQGEVEGAPYTPNTESLEDCVARTLPFWHDVIAPTIRAGKRVIIAAHGNSLRGIVKHLDAISDEDIASLEIPVATPLVYELDEATLAPTRSFYLGEAQVISAPGHVGSGAGKLAQPSTFGLVTPGHALSPQLAAWLQGLVHAGLARPHGILQLVEEEEGAPAGPDPQEAIPGDHRGAGQSDPGPGGREWGGRPPAHPHRPSTQPTSTQALQGGTHTACLSTSVVSLASEDPDRMSSLAPPSETSAQSPSPTRHPRRRGNTSASGTPLHAGPTSGSSPTPHAPEPTPAGDVVTAGGGGGRAGDGGGGGAQGSGLGIEGCMFVHTLEDVLQHSRFIVVEFGGETSQATNTAATARRGCVRDRLCRRLDPAQHTLLIVTPLERDKGIDEEVLSLGRQVGSQGVKVVVVRLPTSQLTPAPQILPPTPPTLPKQPSAKGGVAPTAAVSSAAGRMQPQSQTCLTHLTPSSPAQVMAVGGATLGEDVVRVELMLQYTGRMAATVPAMA